MTGWFAPRKTAAASPFPGEMGVPRQPVPGVVQQPVAATAATAADAAAPIGGVSQSVEVAPAPDLPTVPTAAPARRRAMKVTPLRPPRPGPGADSAFQPKAAQFTTPAAPAPGMLSRIWNVANAPIVPAALTVAPFVASMFSRPAPPAPPPVMVPRQPADDEDETPKRSSVLRPALDSAKGVTTEALGQTADGLNAYTTRTTRIDPVPHAPHLPPSQLL